MQVNIPLFSSCFIEWGVQTYRRLYHNMYKISPSRVVLSNKRSAYIILAHSCNPFVSTMSRHEYLLCANTAHGCSMCSCNAMRTFLLHSSCAVLRTGAGVPSHHHHMFSRLVFQELCFQRLLKLVQSLSPQ